MSRQRFMTNTQQGQSQKMLVEGLADNIRVGMEELKSKQLGLSCRFKG